jgi:hypothetical protein
LKIYLTEIYNSMRRYKFNWFMAAFCSNIDGPIKGNASYYDEDKADVIIVCSKKVSHSNNT